MITFPNAKINIGLRIISRREDGYHNLESIFLPVPGLCDALEILDAERTEFIQTGLEIGGRAEDNIVMKAYNLLATEFGLPPLKIVLHKRIPFGAGLGGGSADAAFMIKMLNEKFALSLSKEKMQKFAARLGADCPFFIENRPAFATGIGTDLKPVTLSFTNKYIAVVKPNLHVSTPEAYRGVTPKIRASSLLDDLQKTPLENWRSAIENDFETTVFQRFPQIAKIKQTLYNSGAIYASMSGSGSAVFGIFNEQKPLDLPKENFIFWRNL